MITTNARSWLCAVVALWAASSAPAVETTWIYAVQVSAAVHSDPTRVELQWTPDPIPVRGYTIHRRLLGEREWGEGLGLPADATSFVDHNVTPGAVYEYQLSKEGATYAYSGFGYISVAVHAPLVEQWGGAVMIVENSIAAHLPGELERFQRDLIGDGWTVLRREVSRDDSPAAIRDAIRAEYFANPNHVKAVILVGRVPIARSGNVNPDGHGGRPFPADVFYGEMDGEWTDQNGDGVYDHTTVPSDVELQVGRIDFADLPGIWSPVPYGSEIDMTKRYFDKNHAYRHAHVRPAHRALVGNSLGDGGGQAYAASGYRNFAALVGRQNIVEAGTELTTPHDDRWISRIAAQDYLWAYACGAGSDFAMSRVGRHEPWDTLWASDFVEHNAKGTFYLFFGSWMVDWSKRDNLLRTALAAPEYGLASAWSGRPHHFYHTMGSGETIGHGIRLTQNNDGQQYRNHVQRQMRGVHIALMGDPTVRLHQVAPPTEATASGEGGHVVVRWRGSSDAVAGYHVYRADGAQGPFTRLTESPVGDHHFVDANRAGAGATYLVRAVTTQNGPSGIYQNASQGAFAGYAP